MTHDIDPPHPFGNPIPLPNLGHNYTTDPFNPNDSVHVTDSITHEERVGDPMETPFDPWELNDGDNDYDRGHFYTRTVLTKKKGGNPHNVQVPLNQDHYLMMLKIIQQRMVPAYDTVQDLIRDAVYHRLHDLMEMRSKKGEMYIDDPIVIRLIENDRLTARSELALKQARGERDKIELFRETLDVAYNTANRTMLKHALEDATRFLDQIGGGSSRHELAGMIAIGREQLNELNRGRF